MEIKKLKTQNLEISQKTLRPSKFDEFIGQKNIVKILKSAIDSANKRKSNIGHILFVGESGFGKTTISNIIANQMGVNIKISTGYAINKPSEMISILNSLKNGDILFIDEIHRIKPIIEEVLYIAMEDFSIDMVMSEGGSIRIPISNFTLIGATTKVEMLSLPLKNRFVYKFHLTDYSNGEKIEILKKYLTQNSIEYSETILDDIEKNIVSTPREIYNLCIKIRDYLISKNIESLKLDNKTWNDFKHWANISKGGISDIHKKYIDILKQGNGSPLGLKTISLKLGLSEKAVEDDIEPLLLKLGIIEKMSRGRILK